MLCTKSARFAKRIGYQYSSSVFLHRFCYTTTSNKTKTMATAFKIQIGADRTGLLNWPQTDDVAATVSDLLQKDIESHHLFFNPAGYHDHIPHHLLALYGTGATSKALNRAYEVNASYQMKSRPADRTIVDELHTNYAVAVKKYRGYGRHYTHFLRYYQEEIDKLGWKPTVLKHVFGNNEESRDLFHRLFSGLVHPLIQFMYGVEWEQPAIVATGLAQAMVHRDVYSELFHTVDEKQKKLPTNTRPRSVVNMIETVREEHPRLVASASNDELQGPNAGSAKPVFEEATTYYASILPIEEVKLSDQIDEMFHTCAYVAVASAFHPPHKPKLDFFLIHHLTPNPFFLWLKDQDWIPVAGKLRLLELKQRMDVFNYIARGAPRLDINELSSYVPKDIRLGKAQSLVAKPEDLLPRFHAIEDDGHTIKVARSLLLAQRLSQRHLQQQNPPSWLRIKDDETWLKAHYMLLDSVEELDEKMGEARWVRSAGLEDAWQNIPKL